MSKVENNIATPTGFERALHLTGGHGRFQWWALILVAYQLTLLTWNHMGYIFLGAVPDHWCHVEALDNCSWSLEQIKNISIPKVSSTGNQAKYDQCQFYSLDYTLLLEKSQGNFHLAYELAHGSGDETRKSLAKKATCQAWTYDDSIYSSTIVTEFNLVCGQRYLAASIQAFYMIAALVGTITFAPLDDKILGRRRSALLGITLAIIGGFLASFAPSYIWFIVARCVVAFGTTGCMQATSIWLMEHCNTKWRANMYCFSAIFFGLGYSIMPLYAYFIRHWSHLQLGFSLTHLSLVSFFWLFPESPRWLASDGRDAEAIAALQNISKFNKISPAPESSDLLECVQQCYQKDVSTTQNNDGNARSNPGKRVFLRILQCLENFRSLLATPELVKISCTVWVLFVSVAFIYYGFAFSTRLTSNPFLLVALGSLMEIPAGLWPIPFLSRWGRRPTTVCCYLFTGIAAFAIVATPATWEATRTAFFMIGKLFVSSAFTVIYVVVSEVYPTVARTTGQGAGTMMGRFGSISAPFVADLLTTVYPDLPILIFGAVALFGSLVAWFLPEMKDVDMKDQVYEFKEKRDIVGV